MENTYSPFAQTERSKYNREVPLYLYVKLTAG